MDKDFIKQRMRILHITDQLGIGGTEILLSNTIPELAEYDHVIVYLTGRDNCHLPIFNNYPLFFLDHTGSLAILQSVIRLRRIIREIRPDLIHAHSFISSIISRLAKIENIRLITTIHSVLSQDAFNRNKMSLLVERLTANRQDDVIAVSKVVLYDYLRFVPFKKRQHILYNFVPDRFRALRSPNAEDNYKTATIKCVAVGGLKTVKNYHYLFDAFSLLPKGLFTLDVYGDGIEKDELELRVINEDLPVRILGNHSNISDVLHGYRIFVQASTYEGFGIAVCEGILSGLIPILSDIPAHREITGNNALYFDLASPQNLVNLLIHHKSLLESDQINRCRDHVRLITSSYSYLNKLRGIYQLE